jgi:hypothetical protein
MTFVAVGRAKRNDDFAVAMAFLFVFRYTDIAARPS